MTPVFEKPNYTVVEVENGPRFLMIGEIAINVPPSKFSRKLVCGVCGATWEGKWNEATGSAIYEGGTLLARRRGTRKRVHSVACRCVAGKRTGIDVATDRQWAVYVRYLRRLDRVIEQGYIETARKAAVQ